MDTMDLAFREYPPILLKRVWITHQTVIDMIIADRGDNSFKLPHMGKQALENKLIFKPTILVSDDALFILRDDNIAQEKLGENVNDIMRLDVSTNRAPIVRNLFPVVDVDDADESQFY
jgi:hypothetical protein